MSRPRTRSQGPPEVDSSEEAQPCTAQRRMSRELQVRLETLRLLYAQSSKAGQPSQPQQQMTTKIMRPANVTQDHHQQFHQHQGQTALWASKQ